LQQVVRGKARDRSAAADAAMGAVMVVGMEPWEQSVGALLRVIVQIVNQLNPALMMHEILLPWTLPP